MVVKDQMKRLESWDKKMTFSDSIRKEIIYVIEKMLAKTSLMKKWGDNRIEWYNLLIGDLDKYFKRST